MLGGARMEWANFMAILSKCPETTFSELDKSVDLLLKPRKQVITLGAGKSSYPAGKLAASLRSIGYSAFQLSSGELLHGDLGAIDKSTLLIGFSFSGETRELVTAFEYGHLLGASTLAVTGTKRSSLTDVAQVSVSLDWIQGADYAGIIPTVSSSAMSLISDVLITCLVEKASFSMADFAKFHPDGQLGKVLTTKVLSIMSKRDSISIIEESASLVECARVMSIYPKGLGVVVNKDDRMVGVISDGDLRRVLAKLESLKIEDLKAKDLMTVNPSYINPEKSIAEALNQMLSYKPKRVSALPVLDGEELLGIISLADIETFRSNKTNENQE